MKHLAIWLWGAVILCVASTSCSRQPDLLRTVPADAQAVACMNVPELARQCGIDFEASTPFTDRTARKLGQMAPLLLAANACGDLSQTYMFVTTGGSTFSTFILTDRDGFEKALNSSLHITPVQNQGYTLYELRSSRTTVALRDNQAWLINHPATLEDLRVALDAASDADMASVTGVAESLGEGLAKSNELTLAVNLEATRGSDRSQWLTINTDVDSAAVKCEVSMINSDGDIVKSEGLLPFDVAALGHIPSSPMMLLGAGLNGRDIDWEMFINPLTMLGGFRARGLYDTLAPYLKALDGTLIVSATPVGEAPSDISDFDTEAWNMIMLAHMPEAIVNQACATVIRQLSMPGVDIRKCPDGSTSIKFGGTQIYVGNVDGYFGVSNRPFATYTPDAAVASLSRDASGVVVINVPSLAMFGYPMPHWGVKIEGRYDGTQGEFTLTLPGSEHTVLQSLIEL